MCRLVVWGAEEEPAPVVAIDHAGTSRSWNAESLARGEKLYSSICITCHGNLTLAARELRISKSTLYLKVEKYGLGEVLREARPARRRG